MCSHSLLAVLDEPNHGRLLSEASPACVQPVLSDQSMGIIAYPACPRILPIVPWVSEVYVRH